jgi:hypothetical protein
MTPKSDLLAAHPTKKKTDPPHLSFFFCLPPDHPQSTKLPQHYGAESDLKEQLKNTPLPRINLNNNNNNNQLCYDRHEKKPEGGEQTRLLACWLACLLAASICLLQITSLEESSLTTTTKCLILLELL